jgi:hypothetical protein
VAAEELRQFAPAAGGGRENRPGVVRHLRHLDGRWAAQERHNADRTPKPGTSTRRTDLESSNAREGSLSQDPRSKWAL